VSPRLPSEWRALELGLQFRGANVRMRIEGEVVVMRSDTPLSIDVNGRAVACAAGRTEIAYANRGIS